MISAMEMMHWRFSVRIGWGVRLGMADAWDVQGRMMDMMVYGVQRGNRWRTGTETHL